MSAFQKLEFRPGIMREATQYGAKPSWWDGDYIRFRAGKPEMIGGWTKAVSTTFYGTCRSLYAWTSLSGFNYLGMGTHLKFYVYNGGIIGDITPLRSTVGLSPDPIATISASNVITITHTAHGASTGDFITISGATAVGGISASLINTEFQITSAPNANTYTVVVAGAASSSTSGGGAGVTVAYQIAVGIDDTVFGAGWGAGSWSHDGWGDAADSSILGSTLRLWSQSNYGEDLIFCPRDGEIYFWDSSANGRGTLVSDAVGADNVPTVASEVLVSNERHVIAFGCNAWGTSVQDKLQIRWATSEDYLTWTPTAENSAGDLRIPYGAGFVTQLPTQNEIIVWTESSVHALRYVGAPFVYGMSTLATKVTIIGPKAKVSVGDTVVWMGNGKFYKYDGRVSAMQCTVEDYVFGDINLNQKWKTYAGSNTAFNELIFFYPSAGSNEVDRYVAWNYVDDLWYYGSLSRTAWIDRSVFDYPIATSTDSYLYYHEFGYSDGSTNPTSAIPAFIESAPLEIGNGETYGFVDQIIPDITFRASTSSSPTATLALTPRRFPGSAQGTAVSGDVARSSVVTVEQFTSLINTRVRGHQMTFKVSSNQADTNWRIGTPRIRVRSDGRK